MTQHGDAQVQSLPAAVQAHAESGLRRETRHGQPGQSQKGKLPLTGKGKLPLRQDDHPQGDTLDQHARGLVQDVALGIPGRAITDECLHAGGPDHEAAPLAGESQVAPKLDRVENRQLDALAAELDEGIALRIGNLGVGKADGYRLAVDVKGRLGQGLAGFIDPEGERGREHQSLHSEELHPAADETRIRFAAAQEHGLPLAQFQTDELISRVVPHEDPYIVAHDDFDRAAILLCGLAETEIPLDLHSGEGDGQIGDLDQDEGTQIEVDRAEGAFQVDRLLYVAHHQLELGSGSHTSDRNSRLEGQGAGHASAHDHQGPPGVADVQRIAGIGSRAAETRDADLGSGDDHDLPAFGIRGLPKGDPSAKSRLRIEGGQGQSHGIALGTHERTAGQINAVGFAADQEALLDRIGPRVDGQPKGTGECQSGHIEQRHRGLDAAGHARFGNHHAAVAVPYPNVVRATVAEIDLHQGGSHLDCWGAHSRYTHFEGKITRHGHQTGQFRLQSGHVHPGQWGVHGSGSHLQCRPHPGHFKSCQWIVAAEIHARVVELDANFGGGGRCKTRSLQHQGAGGIQGDRAVGVDQQGQGASLDARLKRSDLKRSSHPFGHHVDLRACLPESEASREGYEIGDPQIQGSADREKTFLPLLAEVDEDAADLGDHGCIGCIEGQGDVCCGELEELQGRLPIRPGYGDGADAELAGGAAALCAASCATPDEKRSVQICENDLNTVCSGTNGEAGATVGQGDRQDVGMDAVQQPAGFFEGEATAHSGARAAYDKIELRAQ